ncbi:60S ribosomal protein L18a-like protein [Dendrobium catenatum]|uniref:60S ribosomal protein L18a-1 n=1 Tax=Dendrobium catenatum TaxID=906689 RepID=A0A2I0VTJ9_9ASPA|nr:60S ribosomal protein L18a-like protein [Dendrobium catenatum]PKU66742.1 60S ribosomal protein L18a-1 [Dendrobium catenatum]
MSEETEGKRRETGEMDPYPQPKPGPTGLPLPTSPLAVSGTYHPGATAAYPPPASGVYPPVSAASFPPPPVQVPYPTGPPYYTQSYEINPGDAATIAQTTAIKIERLPCWGLGFGWFLFIIGFFLAAIPWYVGAFIILFIEVDYREKPGYIACSIASVIAAVAAFFGLIQEASRW